MKDSESRQATSFKHSTIAHERGRVPDFVRFDNGLEFVAHAVADWCHTSGTEIYRSGFALVERLD